MWKRLKLVFFLLVWPALLSTVVLSSETPSVGIPIPAPDKDMRPYWKVQSFLDDSGVRYDSVFNIAFDSQETIWFATNNGLLHYDGYFWKKFTVEDGLPSQLIRCVHEARDGRLWIGTDKGIGVFDGVKFTPVGVAEGLEKLSVRHIVEDSDGSLWFCCDRWPDPSVTGGLYQYRQEQWRVYNQADGLPSDYIVDYFRDSQGRRFVLTDQGLAQWNGERWENPLQQQGFAEAQHFIWSICESPLYGLLALCDEAIFTCQNNRWTRHENTLKCRAAGSTRQGEILAHHTVDLNHSAFFSWNGERFEAATEPYDALQGGIEQMKQAPDGSVWAVGFNIISRWERQNGKWSQYLNLPPPRLLDSLNRVWFAGPESLLSFDGTVWEKIEPFHPNVIVSPDGSVWGWSENSLTQWQPNTALSFASEQAGLFTIQSMAFDSTGRAWAMGVDAQNRKVVTYWNGTEWNSRVVQELEGIRFKGMAGDPEEGVWICGYIPKRQQFAFFHCSLSGLRTVHLQPSLAENEFRQFHVDQEQNIWLAHVKGLFQYPQDRRAWVRHGETLDHFYNAIVENKDTIFFGYQTALDGGGIACFDKRQAKWTYLATDKIYRGWLNPEENALFAGSLALYQYPNIGLYPPAVLSFPLEIDPLSLVKDLNDNLWVGTERGVLQYHPDGIPPETLIPSQPTDAQEGQTLQIHMEGVEYMTPSSESKVFRYSWKINHGQWSGFQPLSPEGLMLAGLEPGRHVIQMRAQDEDGDIDATVEEWVYYISPLTFYRHRYFQAGVIVVLLLLFVLSAYSLRTKRHLSHYANNLENLVQNRTAALQESEKRYRMLFTEMQNGYLLFEAVLDGDGRPADLIFLDGNRYFEHITGLKRDHCLKKSARKIFPGVEEEWIEIFGRVVVENRPIHFEKYSRFLKRHMDVTAFSPEPGQVAVLFFDVTDRVHLSERLGQAQKIEAVGQLAGGIAHNINNILTGVIGNLSLAESRVKKETVSESMQKYLAEAKSASNRAADLVRQLLEFSRKSKTDFFPVDINQLVRDIAQFSRNTIDKRIQIETKLGDNLPSVFVDKSLIDNAIMNLCLNAQDAILEAMKNSPQPRIPGFVHGLTLSTRREEVSVEFSGRHPYAYAGSFAVIRIQDTGIGMTKEIANHLFEPFFTTKEVGKGTGLGLYSTLGIIKQHNGWIDVTSLPGEGTMFDIYLPINER